MISKDSQMIYLNSIMLLYNVEHEQYGVIELRYSSPDGAYT